jgi:CRP/FNR family cyclic AMP-dependent transcriptional regulator
MRDNPTPTHFVLTPQELRAISAHAVTRSFPRNTIILSEGDRTDTLYVILDGRVKIFVADVDGNEVVFHVQGPGEYFGEMMLDERPRSASVMTLEPSRFLVVPKAELRTFLARNPDFAVRMMEKLIHRVRSLTERVKTLSLMDVYGRVARLLLELAEEREGKLVIAGRLTQQDIASRVGASRAMVSRILKDLSTGGYISLQRDRILVNRQPPLRW